MKPKMYIASCSFGKDSIATILTALEHNEPLDRAVFAEVMFDHSRGISGEIPEHIEWIRKVAAPRLEAMGVKVDIVRAKRDYMWEFCHTRVKGKRQGMLGGFPPRGLCNIQRACKLTPMHEYYKQFSEYDIVQYVGIAADETRRLERVKGNKVSLLAKYDIAEPMALQMAKDAGLLSPIYAKGTRGGCWFCPNMTRGTMCAFRKEHPDLWGELWRLSELPNLGGVTFKQGQTFAQVNEKLDAIDNQQRIWN